VLADDIAAYMATRSLGTVGTDIFVGEMPDSPNNCVALYQYQGEPPELVGGLENPRLTVRVRNTTYSDGQNKARDVLKALHTLNEQTLGGRRYLYIKAAGSISQLGRDRENRALFTVEFIVTKIVEG
jgi:hypothetical protein